MATLQAGIFYPPNWLYYLVDARTGLKWLAVFHLFWAGFWMMLLYRELFPASSKFAPMVASAGFIFCGFMPYNIWWPTLIHTTSWLPCVLFFGERLVQRRSWKWAVLLAIVVALTFLAGFPQFTVYIYFLLCGYVLLRISQMYLVAGRWHELLTLLLLLAAAAVIALLLISPQLLPTLELMDLSERTPGALGLERSEFGGTEAYTFKKLLRSFFFFIPFGDHINFFIMMGVMLSFLDRKNRALISFFALAALLTITLSLGTNTFLYPFYFDHVPAGNWFTTPTRWRLISLFCICMMGARGLNILTDEFSHNILDKKSNGRLARIALIVGFGLLTAAYVYLGGFGRYRDFALLKLFKPPIFLPLQMLGLIIGILLIYRKHSAAPIVKLCIILVVLIEGIFASRYSQPYPSPGNAPYNPAAVNFLRERAGTQRVHLENNDLNARVFPEKSASIFRFYGTTNWEPLSLHRYRKFVLAMQPDSPWWGGWYGHFQLVKHKVLFSLFNLLSPKYIVISDGSPNIFQLPEERRPFIWSEAFPEIAFPLVTEFDGIKIYENPSSLPRAVFSANFTVCEDDLRTLELLTDTAFDPVENPIIDAFPEALMDGKDEISEPSGSKIEIVLMEDERIICKVDAISSGIVWTTDAYYPGWKVKVNGEETRLLKVNYLFRGVAVPKGIHDVEFYYECRPLRLGLFFCASVIIIIPVGFFIERKMRSAP